jgi:diguanylate cyclase (GGDEF)-like protein/PAS domain S-box-containing protein
MVKPGSLDTEILDIMHDGIYLLDLERNVIYWNKGAESISGYSRDEVIGKSCADNILIHVDENGTQLCLDSCPLKATMQDSMQREANVFLHHKKGHRVPVTIRAVPITDESGTVSGAAEIFWDNSQKTMDAGFIEELKKAALFDHLTGIPNRRYIEMSLKIAFDEMKRYGFLFGIIFSDIDHFKKINDTYGHDVGDVILKMVSSTLGSNIRSSDLVGRWGGEEFVLVIKHLKSPSHIQSNAEKLRMLVEESGFMFNGETIKATVTMGAVTVKRGDTQESIIKKADSLLYRGKETGRNRVVFEA